MEMGRRLATRWKELQQACCGRVKLPPGAHLLRREAHLDGVLALPRCAEPQLGLCSFNGVACCVSLASTWHLRATASHIHKLETLTLKKGAYGACAEPYHER